MIPSKYEVDRYRRKRPKVDAVIVESTAIVEQKTLTMQFYLLLVESPL